MNKVTLSAATVESLEVDVLCSADPTGTLPAFALTDIGAYATPSTTFTDGAWGGAFAAGEWLTARTPTLGGSVAIASGDRKWLWIKVTAGSEVAVWLVGTVVVV